MKKHCFKIKDTMMMLAKLQSETLFEEDLKIMELLFTRIKAMSKLKR